MLAEQTKPLKVFRIKVSFPFALVLPVQFNRTFSCIQHSDRYLEQGFILLNVKDLLK